MRGKTGSDKPVQKAQRNEHQRQNWNPEVALRFSVPLLPLVVSRDECRSRCRDSAESVPRLFAEVHLVPSLVLGVRNTIMYKMDGPLQRGRRKLGRCQHMQGLDGPKASGLRGAGRNAVHCGRSGCVRGS